MSALAICPRCSMPLEKDAPQGLCPACLMDQALAPRVRVSLAKNGPLERASLEATAPSPWKLTAPAPQELTEHFPQLEILELIGQGGMGAVYKARQTALDRLVALKIIHPRTLKTLPGDPTFAERFAREARALARLNHPHIVGVYDFGRTGDMYYLIMEYVDGINLRRLLRDPEKKQPQSRQIDPKQALAIVPQICEALAYAHGEGVVHRDIKPENVLLDKRGRVKIADFGLAKLLHRTPTAAEKNGDQMTENHLAENSAAEFQLTGTQQVMGTPHYMSPEQMERPQEVDHRADIFSLGVVLYEMLTGELPLGHFEPPSKKVQVDVRLDKVVLRSLEKQPERRYQHAEELKTDVESLTAGEGGQNALKPDTGGRGLQAADWGGIAVILAVFGLVDWGIILTKSVTPMWGLIVLWWFIAGFSWSKLGKTIGGLMGVFFALAAIGLSVYVTHSLTPLWALLGVFWFASEFGWTTWEDKKEEEEDENQDAEFIDHHGDYKGPVLGLSEKERKLLRCVKRFDPKSDDALFILPSIPPKKLANARRVCLAPADERILALYDLTAWGSAKRCLLIGREGIHFYTGEEFNPQGPISIPYTQFPKLTIINGGDHVALDEQRSLSPRWSSVSCEKLTNLLIALRQTVEEFS